MTKKYFIVSDIHGFYSIFYKELKAKGFDINNENHYLIICGDVFDRGPDAVKLLNYLLKIPEERLILVRGNHEDLLENCLNQLEARVNISQHHWFNGTLDTIDQLTGVSKYDLVCGIYDYKVIKRRLKKYFKLMSRAVDYFEDKNIICVHGWIPTTNNGIYYAYDENWRNASRSAWEKARWYNGMDMAYNGIIEPNKTIICGHWHTGYGHYHYKAVGFTEHDCSDIYFDKGIIALDACTALSGKVNIFYIEV